MSAVARDYVYQVKVSDREKEKKEPTISQETMQAYRADVAKYRTIDHDRDR